MTDTFVPPLSPSVNGTSFPVTANVDRAAYGDGYSQRSAAGLNSVSVAPTLHWDGLTLAQKTDLDEWFSEKAGAEAFYWTVPGESSPRLFTCASWKPTPAGASWSFDATFTQEFDL